jgi:hypothetical protein
MQDPPSPEQLLEHVAAFLRDEVLPQVSGALAFHVRVAANAVDLVRRQIEIATTAELQERGRLALLLEMDGDLESLNRELSERIRARAIDLDAPGLLDHLRRSVLDKLAVDQPKYSAYLAARNDWREDNSA